MKKLVVASAFVVTTASLFLMCDELNNKENDTIVTQSENKQMTRTRTASGLEYEILEEGSGASPKSGDIVTVHYTGWLNDNGDRGQEFDSSVRRNKPYSFKIDLNHVMKKGWNEGVIDMKVGEKRRLYIPSNLAYGPRSIGPVIRANSNLIFDVELIKITVI